VDLKDKARNLLKYRLSANRRSPHGHISDGDWAAIQVGAPGRPLASVCTHAGWLADAVLVLPWACALQTARAPPPGMQEKSQELA
jgi:hypothetical protein